MGFPVAQTLSEEIADAEVDAPRADGLTGHGAAPFQQRFFDVPITEREAVVEPDRVADHGKGEPIAREPLTAQHRFALPQQLATTPQGYVLSSRTKSVFYPGHLLILPVRRSGFSTIDSIENGRSLILLASSQPAMLYITKKKRTEVGFICWVFRSVPPPVTFNFSAFSACRLLTGRSTDCCVNAPPELQMKKGQD